MKYFLIGLATTFLISGCASKNAFSKLNMNQKQEIAVENTRTGKIKNEFEVGGIFSAINLNGVYKKIDSKTIVFYISTYIKDENSDLEITLNGKKALSVKKLPKNNKYTYLSSLKNRWINNFLVTFSINKKEKINLIIKNDKFTSGILNFPRE